MFYPYCPKFTGGEVNDPVLNRAYIMFMKAQDINKNVIKAEAARDFWIADFMFSMANKQFALGLDNTSPGFPLTTDRKIIKEILIDLKIWETDEELETKTDEVIKIINKEYPTTDILKTIAQHVTITDYAVDLLQKMYPKISRTHIIALLLRYGCMYTYVDDKPDGKDIYVSKVLLSIPPPLYHFYNKTLPNVIESFASPINHTLDRFCAIFQDDMEFGAIGPFTNKLVEANKGSTFIVNPPYDITTMNYVSNIIADIVTNNYSICLPSKDGGLFHLYKGRTMHMRDGERSMNLSIDKLLRINTLSGILIIPAPLMFYWSYFKQKKQRLSYDTIMLFYLNDDIDIIEYIKKVQKIILDFAFSGGYYNRTPIHNIEEDKILDLYPMNGQKIINSLKIKF
tara:strand:+ start:2148 stop:3341 length:1194 start_codon:yes stop_codon:yes gene_type:complete